MAVPLAAGRLAARLRPALLALENVMDKVTAWAVRRDMGASLPGTAETARVTAAFGATSQAAVTGAPPPAPPLPGSGSPAIQPAVPADRDLRQALAAGHGH
jgi:hypothetical protein